MRTQVADHIDKKTLEEFYGKPTYMKFNIVDKSNEIYECVIEFEEGWTKTDLAKAVTHSFLGCNDEPEEVFIMEFKLVDGG